MVIMLLLTLWSVITIDVVFVQQCKKVVDMLPGTCIIGPVELIRN